MGREGRIKVKVTERHKSSEFYQIGFSAPDIVRGMTPGQFINVYVPGGAMLLPRPISISGYRGGTVFLTFAVIGGGTAVLAGLQDHSEIEIMGPLGTGFFDYPGALPLKAYEAKACDRPFDRVMLIGGGAGVPPLSFAARKLKAAYRATNLRIEAYLGFRGNGWGGGEFDRWCNTVKMASETEGALWYKDIKAEYHGTVIGLLDEAYPEGEPVEKTIAIACGPRPMLAAAARWCAARGIPLRVSLEERMGCGYGACAGCIVKTLPLCDECRPQEGPSAPGVDGVIRKKVCVHGPVFWADEVIW